MLYHFLYPFSDSHIAFNIFRYITFRSMIAFIIAAVVSIVWGKYFIEFMKRRQFGQIVRDDGPQTHLKKAGTPTMGGIFLVGSIVISLLFAGNFNSIPLNCTLFVLLSYFGLGYADDARKIIHKNTKGVSARGKLVWQTLTALIVGWAIVHFDLTDTNVYIPFFKGVSINFGMFYPIFVAIVIVGTSNAVNLTDGLDGLAVGPIMTSAATLGLLAYVAGHRELAGYLYIPYVEDVGELVVICSAIIGAGIGFLWYNSYPAQIFMGDIGSLTLGGVLGTVAVLTKNEILFVLIGGIFVAEAVSVILQVGSYKLRKKRIFKMAPIHHHFELLGWPEPKVIVRFWIISLVFAILALATLKIR